MTHSDAEAIVDCRDFFTDLENWVLIKDNEIWDSDEQVELGWIH